MVVSEKKLPPKRSAETMTDYNKRIAGMDDRGAVRIPNVIEGRFCRARKILHCLYLGPYPFSSYDHRSFADAHRLAQGKDAGHKTLACTGCNKVKYCCQTCQRGDWLNHKHECYPVGDEATRKQAIKWMRRVLAAPGGSGVETPPLDTELKS